MSRRTTILKHRRNQELEDGKEIGLNMVSRDSKWKIAARKMVVAMEERRKIINDLNIEVGDTINRNGKKNEVLGFTRNFFLIFNKGDHLDPYSILLLGFKIIKKSK